MQSATKQPEQQQQPSTTTTTNNNNNNVGTAPPVVVRRRGRGTFNQPLRADESHANSHSNNHNSSNSRANFTGDAASVLTAITTTVLPASPPPPLQSFRPPEEDLAAEYGGQKRDIPLNIRENFGVCETEHEADTVRQLLFRGEKRRRYCVIVGELQNPARPITLKLFGHKGLKPFKLQNKLIRLVNISVGRPRQPRPVIAGERGNEKDNGNDEDDDNNSNEEEEEQKRKQETIDNSDKEGDHPSHVGTALGDFKQKDDGSALDQQQQQQQQEQEDDTKRVSLPPPQPQEQQQPEQLQDDEVHGEKTKEEKEEKQHEEQEQGGNLEHRDMKDNSSSNHNNNKTHSYEDVDGYADEDNVLPLTVELRGSNAANIGQPSSMANSPVLTATRFDTLQNYFFNEFKHLLSLEDVRMQHVSINLNLGAAYCCLAREGSYSTPLKYATFSEFVQRMNEESMQLYFIKDAPTCVSRAVDRECGARQSEAAFSLVKICFFSNERQSRSVARAMWDAHENRFVLLDMENSGVTFTWTVFSVDESGLAAAPVASGSRGLDDMGKGMGDNGVTCIRKKTVAFPFELEFHAYRRWKQHSEHPAAPIAEAILDKLSLAEHNLIHYGSTIGYENMDFSHICEVDAESEDFNVESIIVEHTSRVKPRGTDLTVDSTSSLWIENFPAARALKNRIAQGMVGGPAMQQTTTREKPRGGRGGRRPVPQQTPTDQKPMTPASRLTFFRSRGSTLHWKLRPGCSAEENLAPLSEALRFAQQVINTANEIERTSVRGGAAPDAL